MSPRIRLNDSKEELPSIDASSRVLGPDGTTLIEQEVSVTGKTLGECLEYLLKVKKELENSNNGVVK